MIRIQSQGIKERLATISRRIDDWSVWARDSAIPIVRGRVATEFLNAVWFRPDGSTQRWRESHPFGNQLGSGQKIVGGGEQKLLIRSGAYYRALMGRGPGALVSVSRRQFAVGVDAKIIPYGPIMRGGSGAVIRTAPYTIRPIKRSAWTGEPDGQREWAMYWFILRTYGVSLSAETLREGMKLYPRPHMTNHPELMRRLVRSLEKFVIKGEQSGIS